MLYVLFIFFFLSICVKALWSANVIFEVWLDLILNSVLSVLLVVFQVWIKRTSSCRLALLCLAAVALATVQPVRSRSSAVLAASKDLASRRLSDEQEKTYLILLLSSFSHSSPACQASCCTLNFTQFLPSFFHDCCSGRRTNDFVYCRRWNISKGKLEYCAA